MLIKHFICNNMKLFSLSMRLTVSSLIKQFFCLHTVVLLTVNPTDICMEILSSKTQHFYLDSSIFGCRRRGKMNKQLTKRETKLSSLLYTPSIDWFHWLEPAEIKQREDVFGLMSSVHAADKPLRLELWVEEAGSDLCLGLIRGRPDPLWEPPWSKKRQSSHYFFQVPNLSHADQTIRIKVANGSSQKVTYSSHLQIVVFIPDSSAAALTINYYPLDLPHAWIFPLSPTWERY